MDNVTHSLAGLLLAEAAFRLRSRRTCAESRGTPTADTRPRLRTMAAIASMIAANLPDADLFYTGVGSDRIGYMLHHRGHTHTVVMAIIGEALLWGIASA
jgi:inner membrane protein